MMSNLSEREKNVLIAGAGVLVLFFGFQFGISPVFEKRETLHRILKEKQVAVEEMARLQAQFFSVSTNRNTKPHIPAGRRKDFSLFSFLDAQAEQSGVKEKVAYMKPFTRKLDTDLYTIETVKSKITEVYLKELVDFLSRVESSANGVAITSLSLSKSGRGKIKLDALIEIETLMPRGK